MVSKMRIGIIGAPASGKTELAEGLLARLKADSNVWKQIRPCKVIDGYVPKLEKRIDMAMSYTAGYIGNLAVVFERLGLEQKARKVNVDGTPGASFISCGTLLDSLAYHLAWCEATAELVARNSDRMMHRWRVDKSIDMYSLLFDDIWFYDLVFWLPGGSDEDLRIEDVQRSTRGLIHEFQALDRLEEVIRLDRNPDKALDQAFNVLTREFYPETANA